LIGIVLFNGIKNSFKEKELYLVLPVIGYLVQAFFNISVIDVAPVFFLSLGLLVLRKNKNFIS
jgi:putative inorganic carbon (HCO3(-)) transporter